MWQVFLTVGVILSGKMTNLKNYDWENKRNFAANHHSIWIPEMLALMVNSTNTWPAFKHNCTYYQKEKRIHKQKYAKNSTKTTGAYQLWVRRTRRFLRWMKDTNRKTLLKPPGESQVGKFWFHKRVSSGKNQSSHFCQRRARAQITILLGFFDKYRCLGTIGTPEAVVIKWTVSPVIKTRPTLLLQQWWWWRKGFLEIERFVEWKNCGAKCAPQCWRKHGSEF